MLSENDPHSARAGLACRGALGLLRGAGPIKLTNKISEYLIKIYEIVCLNVKKLLADKDYQLNHIILQQEKKLVLMGAPMTV